MSPLQLFHFAGAAGANACGTHTGVLPSIYHGLQCDAQGNITLRSLSDLLVIFANVTQICMMIAGGLSVVVILVASIYYITSDGDPARAKRGRDIIQYTAMGLILIIMAYALIGLITANL